MGILSRFKDIMASNINALLDKAENPEKMIDQYLRNLQSEIGQVKAETAGVMAEEARAKREVDACQAEVNKYQSYAQKAVLAGNDADAAMFLTKKKSEMEKLSTLQQAYTMAAANSTKMKQMYDHLNKQVADLENKKAQIKAKIAVAKTQESINKMTSSVGKNASSMAKLAEMDKKADAMLDKANAMAELNMNEGDPMAGLMDKYDATTDVGVQDELAALKAQMGMN